LDGAAQCRLAFAAFFPQFVTFWLKHEPILEPVIRKQAAIADVRKRK
jgi:hypothetical protein